MIYVVLGMHKSGTTLVSRMLHASGIDMGEDIDDSVDYDRGNHYERRSTADINHALLQGCLVPPMDVRFFAGFTRIYRNPEGSSRHYHSLSRVRALPDRVGPDAERRMREVIAACNDAHPEWGFKDPRTCLTYSLWQEHLGDHKVIAVYRGIGQVLQHYGATGLRQAFLPRAYGVLRTWARYNSLLIEICRRPHAPTLVIRYERLLDDERESQRVAAFVGRPLKDVRQADKYRGRAADSEVFPPLAALLAPFVPTSPHEVLRQLEDLRRAAIARGTGAVAEAASWA